MSNEEIKNYKFDDPELDSMTQFNYYFRNALIHREITKQEYLLMERAYSGTLNTLKNISSDAKLLLKDALSDI